MPSAAPVPRGPSVLALGNAAELLTRPGCPVCRHAAEASDRHLAWFALEAHADPVTITRLCASLGMCARHTRRLIGQPGAAARLTVIYRYLLQAAREQLAGPGTRLATCPACQHDQAAAGRALDTLLDGLSETGVRERYLELGGMCWPHVRAAASVRGHRRAVAWIVRAAATSYRRPAGQCRRAGRWARLRRGRACQAARCPASRGPPSAQGLSGMLHVRAYRTRRARRPGAGRPERPAA